MFSWLAASSYLYSMAMAVLGLGQVPYVNGTRNELPLTKAVSVCVDVSVRLLLHFPWLVPVHGPAEKRVHCFHGNVQGKRKKKFITIFFVVNFQFSIN